MKKCFLCVCDVPILTDAQGNVAQLWLVMGWCGVLVMGTLANTGTLLTTLLMYTGGQHCLCMDQ